MRKLILLCSCFIVYAILLSAALKENNNNAVEKVFFKSNSSKGDSCYIYIYRVGQFNGAMANFAIYVDGHKLCKLSNNKYFRVGVTAGTHEINAKVGGVGIMKKETGVEITAENGGEYYVACSVKSSITRVRLEMVEVTKNSGKKQMENMSEDRCQEKIDE